MSRRFSPLYVQLALLILIQAAAGSSQAYAMGKKKVQPQPSDGPVVVNPADPGQDNGDFEILKKAFADPQSIATAQDLPGTLAELKKIAEPSAQYHGELLRVVQNAKTIDIAHLNMILDACSFTSEQSQALQKEVQDLQGKTDADSEKKLQQDEQELGLIESLSGTVNEIVNAGIPKASDLTADNGMAVLDRLFDGVGNAPDAFNAVLKLLSPIPVDQQLKFVDFAVLKGQEDVGAKVALDYFKAGSEHSVHALTELTKHFHEGGKDQLLEQGIPLVGDLTADDVRTLSSAAQWASAAIAEESMKQIPKITVKDAIEIAGIVSGSDKDTVLSQGMARISGFTTDQILALAQAAQWSGSSIILNNQLKVSDLSIDNVIRMAAALSGADKDTLINGYVASQHSFTVSEIEKLANASQWAASAILLNNLNKLSDLNTSTAIELAGHLSGADKDTLIKTFVAKIKSLTTSELISLADASQWASGSILLENTRKLSDLNVTNAIRIAGKLSGADKDTLIKTFVADRAPKSLTTAELLKLAAASQWASSSILMENTSKLNDYTVSNAIQIAGVLSGADKDSLVKAFIASQPAKTLSTSDFLNLAAASQWASGEILLGSLKQVTDLSVANAIIVADHLSGSDKDTYLLGAVETVPDLNPLNLLQMAGHAQWASDSIIAKGKKRLGIS